MREITAPFTYQTRLLNKETDDVIVAMTEAVNDAADAFTDMLDRLNRLYEDKASLLENEATLVKAAIGRTVVDHKDPCDVLKALRVDFLEMVTCTRGSAGLTVAAAYSAANAVADKSWAVYEGLFDDFHYDIGHGKGQGTGEVDANIVVDGFGQGTPGDGAWGDSETSYGAPTRIFERPGNRF